MKRNAPKASPKASRPLSPNNNRQQQQQGGANKPGANNRGGRGGGNNNANNSNAPAGGAAGRGGNARGGGGGGAAASSSRAGSSAASVTRSTRKKDGNTKPSENDASKAPMTRERAEDILRKAFRGHLFRKRVTQMLKDVKTSEQYMTKLKLDKSEVYLLQQLVIERKSRLGHGMSGNVVKCTDANQTKHFAMKGLDLTVYKSKSEKEREKKKKEGGKDGGKDKEDSPLQRIKKKCGVKDDEGENNDAGDKEDKEKRKRKEQDFIASQLRSFEIEVDFLKRLKASNHPNIVYLEGIAISPPHYCILTRLEKHALATNVRVLAFEKGRRGVLPTPMASLSPYDLPQQLSMGAEIASAVAELHKHMILHRDIKSNNVLIRQTPTDGGYPSVCLCDFGIARQMKEEGRGIYPGNGAGTPSYKAPEVISEHGFYSMAGDVWGIGAVLSELFAGVQSLCQWVSITNNQKDKRVLSGFALPPLPDSVPAGPKEVILRCMQYEAPLRPSAAQVAAVLRRLLKEYEEENAFPPKAKRGTRIKSNDAKSAGASAGSDDAAAKGAALDPLPEDLHYEYYLRLGVASFRMRSQRANAYQMLDELEKKRYETMKEADKMLVRRLSVMARFQEEKYRRERQPEEGDDHFALIPQYNGQGTYVADPNVVKQGWVSPYQRSPYRNSTMRSYKWLLQGVKPTVPKGSVAFGGSHNKWVQSETGKWVRQQ